jgi:hypothetical protein
METTPPAPTSENQTLSTLENVIKEVDAMEDDEDEGYASGEEQELSLHCTLRHSVLGPCIQFQFTFICCS